MGNCVVNWRGKEIKFRTDIWKTWLRVERLLLWAHKRKFPNVTHKEQDEKVKEELHELEKASELFELNEDCKHCERNYYQEIADVCFALHGLRRFDAQEAENQLYDIGFNYGIEVSVGVPLMIEKLLEVYFIRTYVNNRHI